MENSNETREFVEKLKNEKQSLEDHLRVFQEEAEYLERVIDDDNSKLYVQISEINKNFETSERKRANLKKQLQVCQQRIADMEMSNGKLLEAHGKTMKKLIFFEKQCSDLQNICEKYQEKIQKLEIKVETSEENNFFLQNALVDCQEAQDDYSSDELK